VIVDIDLEASDVQGLRSTTNHGSVLPRPTLLTRCVRVTYDQLLCYYCCCGGGAKINRSICGDGRCTCCRRLLTNGAFHCNCCSLAPPGLPCCRPSIHYSAHISRVKKFLPTWPRVYAYTQTNLATRNVSLAMLLHLCIGVYLYVCVMCTRIM